MFRQTSAKQTNAQTQARQPNKQAVEGAGMHTIADLIFDPRISREFNLDSFRWSILSEISQREYVRQRQNSKKNFKKERVV